MVKAKQNAKKLEIKKLKKKSKLKIFKTWLIEESKDYKVKIEDMRA
jgi:hypothetical protein